MKITHKKIKASIKIKRSKKIKASIDTGLQYWYLTKHGLGPGMMPPDAHLIDVVEDGWDTYVLLDRMLTTRELRYYDMKEKAPSDESINGSCDIKGVSKSSSRKIPAPFDKYYRLISDEEASDMMGGQPARPTPCEECAGYDIVSEGYMIPKDEYADALFDAGLDELELVSESGGKYFVGYVVGDRVYPVNIAEIESTIEGCSVINSSYDIDDDFDDIPSFDHSPDKVIPQIAKALSISDSIASTIYEWYDLEDAWEDFDSIPDFISFMKQDIYDMAYACDDDEERDKVLNAIRGCSNISSSSTVTKISEDDDSINYVVSGQSAEKLSNVEGSDDVVDEDDDSFFNQPDQEFKSEGTATTGQDDNIEDYLDKPASEVEDLEDNANYDDNEYMGDDIKLKLILDDDVHSDADGELEILTENFIDNIYDRSTDEILEHTGITEGRMKGDLLELIAWYIPMQEGNYHIKADVTLAYDYDGYSVNDGYYKFNAEESSAEKPEVNPILSLPSESTEDAEVESATQVEGEPIVGISPEEDNLNYAIENGLPFDINTFKEYKTDIDPSAVKAEEVEVGDVIDLEFSAEEVDLGTVVKVLAINDPAEPEYGDYSFKVEILQYPDNDSKVDTERTIHFSEGDSVGYLIPV